MISMLSAVIILSSV